MKKPPTLKKPIAASPPSKRLRYVAVKADGATVYLYYRRGGTYLPLPGPEGSDAFLDAYRRAAAAFGKPERRTGRLHTVDDAITHYLGCADYRSLKPATRTNYRRTLDRFRADAGDLGLAQMNARWIGALRDAHAPHPDQQDAGRPAEWNDLRSRMIVVLREYLGRNPEALPSNPWEASRRLKPPKSTSHKPWPWEVLRTVMTSATPEFRALLIGYLMTVQRGGDVTAFGPEQYNARDCTLNLAQQKTEAELRIHVPPHLAAAFASMANRHPDRLFTTPRGQAWTTANAQETLATLLRTLGLDRHTLHGLRATGPVVLKMLGFENRAIRALTGHTSDRTLELYLRGVEHYPLARAAQEAMALHFGPLLDEVVGDGANQRRFAGVTGRAAAKARRKADADA